MTSEKKTNLMLKTLVCYVVAAICFVVMMHYHTLNVQAKHTFQLKTESSKLIPLPKWDLLQEGAEGRFTFLHGGLGSDDVIQITVRSGLLANAKHQSNKDFKATYAVQDYASFFDTYIKRICPADLSFQVKGGELHYTVRDMHGGFYDNLTDLFHRQNVENCLMLGVLTLKAAGEREHETPDPYRTERMELRTSWLLE